MTTTKKLFKKTDFETVEHAMVVINTTTKTQVMDPKLIQIVEFSKSRLTLNLPKNSCAVGHNLMAFILPEKEKARLQEYLTSQDVKGSLMLTGKASAVEPGDKKFQSVTIELVQVLDASWRAFLEIYSKRQKEMDRVLKAVKR